MTDKTSAQPLKAIALKVASLALFIAMQALIKEGGRGMNAGEVTFFRSLFALVPVIGFLAFRGELKNGFRTQNPLGHFGRGFVGVCSMALGFYGILRLPLPESIALGYAMPLLTVIAGVVMLGEQLRADRILAVATGFIGVLVILWPRLDFSTGYDDAARLGALAILASAALAALAMVQVRQLVRTEETATIVLYFSISSAVLSLFTLPFGWSSPGLEPFLLLMTAGFIGGVAQVLLTQSYRYAGVSTVAPFEYTSILWGTLFGWMFFDELPTLSVVIGTVIVMASGIAILMRERRAEAERQLEIEVR